MYRFMILLGLVILMLLASCQAQPSIEAPALTATSGLVVASPEATEVFTPTLLPAIPTLSPTITLPAPSPISASPTITLTATRQPPETSTPTITPTFAILRGEVLVRSNCRYGPGWGYLYKYGLVIGSNLEIFGRTDDGKWILIRAIGGTNPCWVKASQMDIKGDVMAVQPTYIPLPQSPYYAPLRGASAWRDGRYVTISWHAMTLRPGDDSGQYPYLVEAWVCDGEKLKFTPIGTYETSLTIVDEPGCIELSYGRVYGVEKHGYTRWIEIPWPQNELGK
jgi:hypothetical protein